ncbi:hypothetical protein J1N35_017328 [Gossypium stocksii]|uniref:Uncharacterized protein n=1 Tax=Gossypium stocksii TaxID=47602 RepID=A0A9D4A640_9ROSI|nr:hypothetical protein J1N35_017328 [Gossypium stocksii]
MYILEHVSGDKFSTDWDKAWSNFKKQSKRSFFSGFSPICNLAMEKAEGEVKQKRVPPKRGQIKVRIISIVMESVLRIASKVGRRLQRKKNKVASSENKYSFQKPDSHGDS